MNEIHVAITVRNVETKEELRPLGAAVHPLTDPGEDVQAIHGWKRYIAARLGDAVVVAVVAELLRDDVSQDVPVLSSEELEQAAADLAAESAPPPPEVVRDLLLLVAEEIPREDFPVLEEIETWDEYVRAEVAAWAGAIHLTAGDHEGLAIPPVPAVLQGGDDAEGDDEGAADPEDGAAGAPAAGGEAGAAPSSDSSEGGSGDPAAADGAAPGPDDGGSPGDGGEDDAGSAPATEGGEGGGEVSRPRARRRRSSQES